MQWAYLYRALLIIWVSLSSDLCNGDGLALTGPLCKRAVSRVTTDACRLVYAADTRQAPGSPAHAEPTMSPYTYPPTNVHVCPAQSTASRGTREARSDPAEDMQGATGQTGRVRRGDVCHPMGEGRGGAGRGGGHYLVGGGTVARRPRRPLWRCRRPPGGPE